MVWDTSHTPRPHFTLLTYVLETDNLQTFYEVFVVYRLTDSYDGKFHISYRFKFGRGSETIRIWLKTKKNFFSPLT